MQALFDRVQALFQPCLQQCVPFNRRAAVALDARTQACQRLVQATQSLACPDFRGLAALLGGLHASLDLSNLLLQPIQRAILPAELHVLRIQRIAQAAHFLPTAFIAVGGLDQILDLFLKSCITI